MLQKTSGSFDSKFKCLSAVHKALYILFFRDLFSKSQIYSLRKRTEQEVEVWGVAVMSEEATGDLPRSWESRARHYYEHFIHRLSLPYHETQSM